LTGSSLKFDTIGSLSTSTGSSIKFDTIGSLSTPTGSSTKFDVIGVSFTITGLRIKNLNIDAPLPAYPRIVSNVPVATAHQGSTIYVTDETGGAILAFSDGTNWLRVTDRAVIS